MRFGTDCFRQVIEAALKGHFVPWRRYEKRRVTVSERLSVEYLTKLLEADATLVNLEYFRPNPGVDAAQLGLDRRRHHVHRRAGRVRCSVPYRRRRDLC